MITIKRRTKIMLERECYTIKRTECRRLGAKNSRTIGPIIDLRKA
jgi:hypothetical protein